ncbi:MAG: CoB--CoM heterodisulfide reductase iron-sulfur subunit B family protein [Bacillota bacterium]|nr:CoB--CoM heterodisulfide reductase iron-sulfur subunit B family protein [Bacillota bacterium]
MSGASGACVKPGAVSAGMAAGAVGGGGVGLSLAYYPGCSLHSTGWEFDASTRAVCAALGIELRGVPGWTCCGSSSAHTRPGPLGRALGLRNLVLAEDAGEEMLVPCAACYNVLKGADAAWRAGEEEAREAAHLVEDSLGRPYRGKVAVRHVLEVLALPGVLETLRARVRSPWRVPVVPYYGCLLARPSAQVGFDRPEQPVLMDRILEAIGAEVRPWSYKTDCCGASLTISHAPVVEVLVNELIKQAGRAGALALVTACPMCHANLDSRQSVTPPVPVLYITEAVGIALGLPDAGRWLGAHLVDARALLTPDGEMVS